MKKIVSLMVVAMMMLSITACGGGNKEVKETAEQAGETVVAEEQASSEIVGEWVVTGSEIKAEEKILKMQFELAREMAYFEGAVLKFHDDGKCELNGQVATYTLISDNEFESTNSDGAVTRTKFTIDGNNMKLDLYAGQFIVNAKRAD